MNDLVYVKEKRAYALFQKLLEDAEAAGRAFADARLPLPAPLARMLAQSATVVPEGRPRLMVTPLERPEAPPDASDDWIWVSIANVSLTSLVFAVLRASDGHLQPRVIVDAVTSHRKDVNPGSIYNALNRMAATHRVNKSDEGLKLSDPESAPKLYFGYVWGPASSFQKYDLAEHRRMVVLHLLGAASLQIVQITEQLQDKSICRAPATKDLVKVDLDILQEKGLVRRVGNSKKWELIRDKN